jgi:hypothetical protein
LLSYSKKPPKGADTLPEVFELALELVDFHGGISESERGGALKRPRMLSPQLDL